MREPSSASITRRVEWIDTDASGHYHNSLIIRLMEAAEARLIGDAGLRDLYFASAPRVRHEIDFTSPLYFGQDATTTLTLQRVGTTSLTWRFEVWGEPCDRSPERRLAASGLVVVAHVARGDSRATPWPDAVRRALVPAEDGEAEAS